MNELTPDFLNFLGSRSLTTRLKQFFIQESKVLPLTAYRGLPYPKHLIQIGHVVDEWHESSHWTPDRTVAEGFARSDFNECYYEELVEELGEDAVEFVELVLICDSLVGYESYQWLQQQQLTDFASEKEITVVGYDFQIQRLETWDEERVVAYVTPVK